MLNFYTYLNQVDTRNLANMFMLPYQVVYNLSKHLCYANYSDMTSSSVFSHHTQVRPEGGFVRTQRTPLDPPLQSEKSVGLKELVCETACEIDCQLYSAFGSFAEGSRGRHRGWDVHNWQ